MIWIYRLLVYPILRLAFYLSIQHNKKVKLGWTLRKKRNGVSPWILKKLPARPVWIHAASGEFEYARPLIRDIKRAYPHIPILVTYFSPTYRKVVENTKEVDFSAPLPWDSYFAVKEFLQFHRPRALFLSRTDLWPELLHQTREQEIPSILFSATLSPDSKKMQSFLKRSWLRYLLSIPTKIYCVNLDDASSFKKLGLKNIEVAGDTRYDQVLFRLTHPKFIKPEFQPKPNEKLIVFGSTWDEDEAQILKVLPQIADLNLKIIIAPHEPTQAHIEKLEASISNAGLSTVRYNESMIWPLHSIMIIDTVGILADLYKWANLAFVGGSFKQAVHSVMEPLAAGCFTFFGPLHKNNREAIDFQSIRLGVDSQNLTCAQSVTDAVDLLEKITSTIRYLEQTSANIPKEAIIKFIRDRTGATQKIFSQCQTFLN